jgi:hypothetical protein
MKLIAVKLAVVALVRCFSPAPNPCPTPAPIERCYLRTTVSHSFCGNCHTDVRRAA